MAEDKKPPQKPSQKKASGGKDAGKKTTAQNNTGRKAAQNARTRKASRPPIIDLKAEEVSPGSENKAKQKPAQPDEDREQLREDQKDKPQKTGDTPKTATADKKQAASVPPQDKPKKGSGLAAGGIGLVAGLFGGLAAGFIYSNTQTDALPPPALAALENRVQNIEKAGATTKTDGSLLTRLDKAESDTRFLNTQLGTLSKDISKLKEQLALFSGSFTQEGGGTQTPSPPAPVVDLSGIEGKIAELEQKMNARASSAEALREKLQALQNDIQKERTALSIAGEKQTQSYQALTKSVDEKIANLYQAGSDNRIRAAALSLSFGQLAQAAKLSHPFPDQLKAVGTLLAKNEIVEKLLPLAEKGVPDIAVLRESFARINFEAAPQTGESEGDNSLVQKLINSASSVVKVSKIGEEPGAEAPIDKLKTHLKAGDLAALMEVSKSLEASMLEKLQPWLAGAQHRLTLDEAMVDLHNLVLAEIGRASSSKQESPAAGNEVPPAQANEKDAQ